jgi:hypothetical protein
MQPHVIDFGGRADAAPWLF